LKTRDPVRFPEISETPGRPDLEFGDKIILPQEAFRTVSNLKLPFPLIFEVQNERRKGAGVADKFGNTATVAKQYCGVLEFSAPEEQAYLPYWMMQNLLLREGGRVVVKSAPKVCIFILADFRFVLNCCWSSLAAAKGRVFEA
jgi:Ubiquitin fusion degradation protein UFD1